MSSTAVTFYDVTTGQIVGHYQGPIDWVALNQPAGCGHVAGIHQQDSAEVDPATRLVVQRSRLPSLEELELQAKAARDSLLASSDWVTLRAADTCNAVPDVWLAYRQALRDITQQPGWPGAINWPERPQE